MAKIQDIDIPYLEFAEAAAPGTPAAGIVRQYAKSDGLLYSKDDAGAETLMSGGAGGGAFVGAKATNTAGTSMTGAAETVVPYATEEYDTNTFHDNATNNSRLTVPSGQDGYYRITGQWALDSGSNTGRYAVLRKNGTTLLAIARGDDIASTATFGQVVAEANLVATDYVEMLVFTSHTLALQTAAGRNWLAIAKMGT